MVNSSYSVEIVDVKSFISVMLVCVLGFKVNRELTESTSTLCKQRAMYVG